MNVVFKLSSFEGPLDMLLFLIGKAKIDIRDVFVSEITDQYVRSVQEGNDLDMDEASAFIQMAATLLEIKSRSLLPKAPPAEEEEDPETALIRQLEAYALIKQMAQDMQAFEKAAALMYEKLPEEYPEQPKNLEITGLTLEALSEAFAELLQRVPKETEEPGEAVRRIIRDEYTVPGCMAHILKRLRHAPSGFTALLSDMPSVDEVVTLFLAVLELLRLGHITCAQDRVYEEIVLYPVKKEKKAQERKGPR